MTPCPFCGSEDVHLVRSGNYARCEACKADGPMRDTPAEAEAAWDARAEPITNPLPTVTKLVVESVNAELLAALKPFAEAESWPCGKCAGAGALPVGQSCPKCHGSGINVVKPVTNYHAYKSAKKAITKAEAAK